MRRSFIQASQQQIARWERSRENDAADKILIYGEAGMR